MINKENYDITLTKLDEIHLRIDCDKGILREIYELFSFYKEGYKYAPSYKAGVWDGKIKLLNLNSRKFPLGLLNELLKFCKEGNYRTKIVDKDSFRPKDFSKEIEEYLCKMGDYTNYSFTGKYEFQYNTVKHCLEKQKALVVSPTACLDPNTVIEVLLDEQGIEYLNEYRE